MVAGDGLSSHQQHSIDRRLPRLHRGKPAACSHRPRRGESILLTSYPSRSNAPFFHRLARHTQGCLRQTGDLCTSSVSSVVRFLITESTEGTERAKEHDSDRVLHCCLSF